MTALGFNLTSNSPEPIVREPIKRAALEAAITVLALRDHPSRPTPFSSRAAMMSAEVMRGSLSASGGRQPPDASKPVGERGASAP